MKKSVYIFIGVVILAAFFFPKTRIHGGFGLMRPNYEVRYDCLGIAADHQLPLNFDGPSHKYKCYGLLYNKKCYSGGEGAARFNIKETDCNTIKK